MSKPTAYAHTLPNRRPEDWEPLERHLQQVASLAGEFASAFGSRDWGEIVGGWHDLGKYSDAFQAYIRQTGDPDAGEDASRAGQHVDHSTFGAQHAVSNLPGFAGQLVAFAIAGHHAGLADITSGDESSYRSTLVARLKAGPPRVPLVTLPGGTPRPARPRLPFDPKPADAAFDVSLFTRMIFSCLVDADRLATEAFCDPAAAAERKVARPTLLELEQALDGHLTRIGLEARPTLVNRVRAEVLDSCRSAAAQVPGFFSLTVPTGGGKTYSSLAFALRHARAHGLRRIVFGIPFTTIIEQTAAAYRTAMGRLADLAIVEHHSNRDPDAGSRINRLGTENWDAPLVVTTNVQLFESLFASATTPCRKLHRLAQSVIVLDEAQTLPVDLLAPTLAALRALVSRFGCSIVLCTATQPALEWRDGFPIGLKAVRPIIPDPAKHFETLRRVTISRLGKVSDEALIKRISDTLSALCIVNTRKHAASLFGLLCEACEARTSVFHLSTYMCGAHRKHVLANVRRRLRLKLACHVVSTQLVEAGVDIDFPVVFRAPAGFDSIAQSAGRCNREGLLDTGHLYLFDSQSPPPPGLLRQAAETAHELSQHYPNPIAPEAVSAYFRQLYWSQSHRWDSSSVLGYLGADFTRPDGVDYRFRAAALAYRIIPDGQSAVLVPYGEAGRELVDLLVSGATVTSAAYRAMQPFVINVYPHEADSLSSAGVVVQHDSGIFALVNDSAYSQDVGLSPGAAGMNPALLIQ